ncbi:MAG: RNA-binding protein [Chloroflexi bacterium]|nr:RNA-binding protein [Chloroflexota bacterium]
MKLRIYVGNFGFDTREQELREAFEAHGTVQEVAMMQDRDTGRSKGFAFVEMPTGAEAQAAIGALNGKEFGGRSITVNEARPRPERSSFGGGSGGSGGGYGGNSGGGGGGRGSRW